MAHGTQESLAYDGPEGRVYKQEGLAFTQYHARRNGKARYYGSLRGAVAWLKKQAQRNVSN